jgi:hypothetical protein
MKEAVREVIAKVEGGELERNSAAVILQGYRVLKDLVELERKVREQEEVLQRLDALERRTQGGKIGGDK